MPFPGGPSSPWGADDTCHCDPPRPGMSPDSVGTGMALLGLSSAWKASPNLDCLGVPCPPLPGPWSRWAGKVSTCSVTAVSTNTEGTVTCGECSLSSYCNEDPHLDSMSPGLEPRASQGLRQSGVSSSRTLCPQAHHSPFLPSVQGLRGVLQALGHLWDPKEERSGFGKGK